MISAPAFAHLRVAATLNFTFPGLSTRVRDGDRVVAEVAWPPSCQPRGASVVRVHPSAFRRAVADAWGRYQGGEEMQLLDLPGDPIIEMGAVAGGRCWPSGIVRIPLAGQFVYAFGTTLDPTACATLGRDLIEEFGSPERVVGIAIEGDADTGTSLVYAEATERAGRADHCAVYEVLEQLIARYATFRLIEGLDEGASHADRRR